MVIKLRINIRRKYIFIFIVSEIKFSRPNRLEINCCCWRISSIIFVHFNLYVIFIDFHINIYISNFIVF